MRQRRSALLAVLLSIVVVGSQVRVVAAQDLKGEALKEFQTGKSLKDAGNCKDAAAHFEKSLQLQPDQAGTLYYLAQCDESLGRMSSAYTHYTESELVARKLSADPATDKKVKAPHDAAARVEPKIDQLKIAPPNPAPSGLAITIGESAVPASAWSGVPVDPGTYVVHASAPGKKPWSKEVTISGEAKTETVTVDALVDDATATATTTPATNATAAPTTTLATAPPTTNDVDASSSSGSRKTIGIVVGIAGVVVAGAGVVLGLGAKSKMNDSKDNHCGAAIGQTDANRCDATGLDLRDSARKQADLSTVLVLVGGAAAATGLVLVLTAPSQEQPKTGATALLRVGFGSVALEGAF